MQDQKISESSTIVTQVNQGKTLKRLASFALGIGGVAITVFILSPSPIAPVAWKPAPSLSMTGVLAPDESYVLVADQFRYQIKRFWLKGEKAGQEDIFANNLPGFVHNI